MTGKQRSIFISVTCLGMSSLITQIITLREFLNILAGNELIIGLILANWLLLTGLGSYLGRYISGLKNPVRWLVIAQVIIALLPLLQISSIRMLRKFFVPGLMLGFQEAFLYSFILLLPYCVVSGFLLTLFSSLGGEKKDAVQIGDIYVLDVIGDIIGGLLFSFVLIYYFGPFQALTFLLILNLCAATLVSSSHGSFKTAFSVVACLCVSLAMIGLFNLEKITGQALYQGQEMLFQKSTPYGNLAITRSENQITVYENGIPAGSTQNTIAAEESVHYALSQLPAPENILMVSGGLNGALHEALKYPLKKIEYLELDPEVVKLVQKLSPEAADERVKLIATDGRRYIRSKAAQYDAILLDLADPVTAQINRFYTLEFFRDVRKALRPGGVFGFGMSGAENYANPEISRLSATVFNTLHEVFPNILIIPGGRQYYIASSDPLDYDISAKLKEKIIFTRYVNAEYLQARLTADRISQARQMVSTPSPLNLDFRPASYYSLLQYWLSKFQSSLLLPILIAGIIAILIIALLAQTPRMAPPLALSLSGFSGIGLEIAILLAFQVIYGFVYQQLGIIITAFLIGTALGGFWSVRNTIAAEKLIFRIDISFAILSFLIVPVFLFLQSSTSDFLLTTAPLILFPLLTTSIGFLVGAQFPVAARLTFHGLEKTAGTLYSLDFLGAALGALLVSTFAVPLLGIIWTCYLIGTLKLLSSLILWLQRKKIADIQEQKIQTETSPQLIFTFILLVFSGVGILVYNGDTTTSLYSMSFYRPYHWLLLGLLAYGIIQAMHVRAGFSSVPAWKNMDRAILKNTKMGILRWIHYASFSLLIFFPIFRCYFKVPYLFCHVCPRQCAFGYLRAYLVPAALIMNIEKRYWCFHCCPIGTFFDCQARVSPKSFRLQKIVKILPISVLLFTAISYFKISNDLADPGATINDWYTFFFINIYTPTSIVIGITVLLIVIAFKIRRSFCELLCPVGTLSDLILKIERLPYKNRVVKKAEQN